MTHHPPRKTPTPAPRAEAPENAGAPAPGLPDVVPPEIERDLAPHTEVRLVYWLRREYWTRLIKPLVSTIEERKTQ